MKRTLFLMTCRVVALALPVHGQGLSSAAASPAPASETAAGKLDWLTDLAAAKEKAKGTKKLIFIDFTGSDWCPPCKLLQKEVFSQPEFAAYAAENLVLVEVDFPRRKPQSSAQKAANEKLQDEFGIDGYPTIVVLNSAGKPLGKLGYMPGGPQAFIEILEKARTAEK